MPFVHGRLQDLCVETSPYLIRKTKNEKTSGGQIENTLEAVTTHFTVPLKEKPAILRHHFKRRVRTPNSFEILILPLIKHEIIKHLIGQDELQQRVLSQPVLTREIDLDISPQTLEI